MFSRFGHCKNNKRQERDPAAAAAQDALNLKFATKTDK